MYVKQTKLLVGFFLNSKTPQTSAISSFACHFLDIVRKNIIRYCPKKRIKKYSKRQACITLTLPAYDLILCHSNETNETSMHLNI